MESANFVVAHAGMGSIITALTLAKPLVIMPRRADLGEHRNDHQTATVARFLDRAGIFVAADETALVGVLDDLASGAKTPAAEKVGLYAEARLVAVIRDFIHGEGER
jgi:UDP-N-acetylglucosamine transferase subunit ALG13